MMYRALFSLLLLLLRQNNFGPSVEAAPAFAFVTPSTPTTPTFATGGRRCPATASTTALKSSSRLNLLLSNRHMNNLSLACYQKSCKRCTSSSTLLSLSSSNNNNNSDESITSTSSTLSKLSTSSSARERGIYARPSAAIERGSGFFIPGLEGSRIRFVFGILVVVLVFVNHFFFSMDDVGGGASGGKEYGGMVTAELISAFYGIMLILQGSIDFGVARSSRGVMVGSENSGEGVDAFDGNDDDNLRSKDRHGGKANGKFGEFAFEDALQRISRALVAYTPATEVRLVSEDHGILYSFGVTNRNNNERTPTTADGSKDQKQLIKLCLDAVSSSRGGSRVALSPDHPASKLLPVEATRCILVQKVDDYRNSRTCIIVGSDKLLPSYTKNDLRWLGQLAQYNNLMVAQREAT